MKNNNINKEELRRCPFCGNTVEVKKWSAVLYYIQCKGCGCEMQRETEEEVKAAWNTRFGDYDEVDDECGLLGYPPGKIEGETSERTRFNRRR